MGPVLGAVNGGGVKIPTNLNALDVSVKKLQRHANIGFSNYELTNKKERARKQKE